MADRTEAVRKKIEKLEATLERHRKILKGKMEKLAAEKDEDARFWLQCDVDARNDDIRRTQKRIAEAQEKLALAGAAERRKAAVEAKIPGPLKEFRDHLVAEWNEWDRKRRDEALAMGDAWWRGGNGRKPQGSYGEYMQMKDLTDERIDELNRRTATGLALNLLERIEKHVGRAESFGRLYVTKGNWMEGGAAINGTVTGEKGTAVVDSILAGGWNVQRLHVRVLVKKEKPVQAEAAEPAEEDASSPAP